MKYILAILPIIAIIFSIVFSFIYAFNTPIFILITIGDLIALFILVDTFKQMLKYFKELEDIL